MMTETGYSELLIRLDERTAATSEDVREIKATLQAKVSEHDKRLSQLPCDSRAVQIGHLQKMTWFLFTVVLAQSVALIYKILAG
jgi:hypothetical protein